jgi:hypothetical protein
MTIFAISAGVGNDYKKLTKTAAVEKGRLLGYFTQLSKMQLDLKLLFDLIATKDMITYQRFQDVMYTHNLGRHTYHS